MIQTRRIGLYGGAFDPVHTAHLELARIALEEFPLNEVIFIPAAQSPLKMHTTGASGEERLRMLELATRQEERFRVDAVELARGGSSFSWETAEHFQDELPNAELYWILGADQFEQLDRWREIERLAGAVIFLVMARQGHSLKAPEIPGLRYFQLDAPLMTESSTEVRRRCREGESVNGLVPEGVRAFIEEQSLYTSED